MKPRIFDRSPRQFGPNMAVGSAEFMQFIMDVDQTIADGVTSWRRDGVERRDGSEIEGQGLFTTIDIEQHEILAVKGGRVVNEAEVRKLTAEGTLHGSQQQIGLDLFLVGLTEAEEDKNMIGYNHSCSPNAFFTWSLNNMSMFGTAFLVSRKAIPASQEITTDHSVSHVSKTHRFVCNCQSPDCRVIIQPRYDYLSPEFQKQYKGEFPVYIQELIDDLGKLSKNRRESVLYSARFGETVGKISMIDGEIRRLEGLASRDDVQTQRLERFRLALLMSSALLVGTYPGVAQACGIEIANAKQFQKSVTEKIDVVVGYARKADEEHGWIS
ncbi:MAG TPA: SET domain-containing protein-lysine N-methyltransferase [Candidatus Saccharimonadales bacterium]